MKFEVMVRLRRFISLNFRPSNLKSEIYNLKSEIIFNLQSEIYNLQSPNSQLPTSNFKLFFSDTT